MAAHKLEKRQARVVQDITGAAYQNCLRWVRDNQGELRALADKIIPLVGLAEGCRRAAAQLARERGPKAEEG